MNNLKIGATDPGKKPFSLSLDAVTSTIALLAKRGSGKSYTASVIAEEFLSAQQQVIAIDPTGAWWGLKSSADGERAAFPVVVFGGDHADIPLEETAGEVIARTLVEKRFSAVIDLSLLKKGAIKRFLAEFLEAVYRLNREPLHLICDEVDVYAPQRPFGDEARVLGAMEDIVRRGRKKGIGSTLISQRPQVVNKDVLTQADMLIAMRLIHPKDLNAVREWVEVHADERQAEKLITSLPDLPVGTAWVWAPGENILERVKIRHRSTFDSGATPKPGERLKAPKALAAIDVKALGHEIAATVERVKADDPKTLRARIAELEKRKPEATPASTERVVSVLTPEHERSLRELHDGLATLARSAADHGELLSKTMQRFDTVSERLRGHIDVLKSNRVTRVEKSKGGASVSAIGKQVYVDNPFSKACRAVLSVLASYGPCEKSRLALLSGYSYSGGFRNTLSELRTSGLIEGGNEEVMSITHAGLGAIGDVPPLPKGSMLARHWLQSGKFGKAECSILEALLNNPGGMDAEGLALATGYEYSGGFRNSLSKLRTAGVLVGKNTGVMKAHDDLFDSLEK